VGFISKVRNVKIQVGASALPADPAVLAQRARDEYATRALYGAAGLAVYGPGPEPEPAPAPPPPPAFADREQQAAHERRLRDAARDPYLSPSRTPVVITRVASRGGNGVADLTAHLTATGLSGRPDLVFGVYRVPDHVGGSATTRARRYVEWDVVHAAHGPLSPGPASSSVFLDARQQWVARASGEPSILDEDLAAALLHWAGIGPEHVLGIAREVASTSGGGGGPGRTPLYARMAVTGVSVLWSGPVDLAELVERVAATAPFPLPSGPPPGVHVESLNWRAIAKAVSPRTGAPFLVPSPFPHLPSTPQELLTAHLDVVGVRPADCLSAQVTLDREMDVLDKEGSGWATSSRSKGLSQPCVDGKDRPRLAGATHVIVAYRDQPEYAEGRERWAAYQRDVLQARLENRNGARRPVPPMELGSLGRGTRTALKAAGAVAAFVTQTPDGHDKFDDVPEARYCWPPTDIR
jgi:hypothetical protein